MLGSVLLSLFREGERQGRVSFLCDEQRYRDCELSCPSAAALAMPTQKRVSKKRSSMFTLEESEVSYPCEHHVAPMQTSIDVALA